jgi:hypothetical protein
MLYVVSVFLIILSSLMGWLEGQRTVATECRLLGAFYVGTTVYECRVKEKV